MTTLPQKTNYRFPKPVSAAGGVPTGPVSGGGGPGGQTHAMTPADVWRILRASMWVIIAIMVASFIGGIIAYIVLGKYFPRYTALGLVQVDPIAQFDIMQPFQAPANREVLEMEQRTQSELMSQETLYSYVLTNNNEVRATDWFKSFNGDTEDAKQDLLKHFQTVALPTTKLIQVTMETHVAKDARVLVDAIVSQHILDRQRAYKDQNLNRSATLNRLLDSLRLQRNEKQRDIREKLVKLNTDGGGTPGTVAPKEIELSDLIKREMDLRAQYDIAKSQLDAVNQRLQNGEDPPAVLQRVDQDPIVSQYRQQIDQTDMELATMGDALMQEHDRTRVMRTRRDVLQQKLDDAVADIKGRTRVALIDELQGAMGGAKATLDQVTERMAAVQKELGDLKDAQSQYLQLVQDEKELITQIGNIQRQVDEIGELQKQNELAGVMWATHPQTPQQKSFPRIPLTMAAALALGMALSVAFAFLRELLNTTVRSPYDIARMGHVTVLGTVPDEADDPEAADVRLPLTIAEAPQSIIAEHVRQIRTRLQQATSLDTTRSILITSPDPQDGKTVISCNIAAGLALNGRKILLVDSNFRRPDLHSIFALSNAVGFSDVLTSPERLEQCVHETQVPNLSVLCSGPKPANATELLESQLLIDFIERALEDYDHVIFDSGPLLFVSDAVALAPRVDGVITVLRAKRSTRGVLQRTRDVLRQLKAEHLGVVLNGVRSHGGGYYRRNIRTYYEYSNEQKPATIKKR